MKNKKIWLVLLVLLSLIPLLDFFRPGLPLTHDGQDHVARIANFYQSLLEGNLIPRWAANLNWGYGHPILMFLYPLPSYLASFFHFLGFSLVASTKIVFGLSFFLSGIFMYIWIRLTWGEKAGLAAGLVYLFAPYRFVDLFVRGAIGECWAFVWPPLICYFALKLSREGKWGYLIGGSLSLAALILSHNALSLMFFPLILGYFVFLIYQMPAKQRRLIIYHLILIIFFGVTLSAFFWFPAFFEGKYTLRDIVTKDNFTGFESFSRLLWSAWSYGGTSSLSVQVGILQWLMVLLTPFLIWKLWRKQDKSWLFLSFLFICFWLAIFLILPGSRFLYLKITLLQKFQFVWRFLSLAIFPPAIFAGALVFLLPKKFKTPALFFLLLSVLIFNKNYWHAKGFLYNDDSFFSDVYSGTTDTGESAPRWSVRFMEKFPQAPIEVIEGEVKIRPQKRLTKNHQYQIEASVPSRIAENTLYFPGWVVLVDGQPTEIEFQDPAYRGLMTFNVPQGKHEIVVQFRETKLRLFADWVSLIGLSLLVLGGKILRKR